MNTMDRSLVNTAKNSYAVYEKRLVAFMDILGFSTMIVDSKIKTGIH